MNMIDMLLNLLKSGFEGIMKMVYMLFDFLGKAFGLLFWFLDGIFYFVGQLFLVLIKVVMLFVVLFQFLGAIVVGFLKTIGNMLVMHASSPNLPSKTGEGLNAVTQVLSKIGFMDVVPLVLTGLIWFFFVKKLIGLFGGEIKADA